MSTDTKTSWRLEMTSPSDFRPKTTTVPGLRIERAEDPSPEFAKYLHMLVGHPHRWGGRVEWTQREWTSLVQDPGFELWVGFLGASPVGYFELKRDAAGGAVQIVCFGLLPQYVGRGLGGPMLSRAVERAWGMGATRVWLSTCSHDHPHAIENYKARGFRVTATRESPANAPWPSFWDSIGRF